MRILLSLTTIFLLACPSAEQGPGFCVCYGDTYGETGGIVGEYFCREIEAGETNAACQEDEPACTWHPEAATCEDAKGERDPG